MKEAHWRNYRLIWGAEIIVNVKRYAHAHVKTSVFQTSQRPALLVEYIHTTFTYSPDLPEEAFKSLNRAKGGQTNCQMNHSTTAAYRHTGYIYNDNNIHFLIFGL